MRLLAAAVAILVVATAAAAGDVRRLRLCADPSNPPFSQQDGNEPGFEVEIGRAIANVVGAEFTVHWFPTVREAFALRQLYESRCDVLMGVPLSARYAEDKPRLSFSAPYYVMRLAVVSSSLGGVGSLDDLKTRLVGVQAMTLGDYLAYERGYNRKIYVTAEETFLALVKGDVDAVVMESPLAGWYAKKNPGFRLIEVADPGRELKIGAALRKDDHELKAAVDRAIRQLESTQMREILSRYGLAQAGPPTPDAMSPELRAARSTFLTQCSQCHGVDAKGTAAAADLQAFKGTEDDFVRIARNGRPGTAMTPWKGIISDDELLNIARYIKRLGSER